MPTPRNSRADTLINAMLNAVGGDEPPPSPLPRESLLLPLPCQYHPRLPGSPRDDPPPEPPPEPPPRPLRPPVLLLPGRVSPCLPPSCRPGCLARTVADRRDSQAGGFGARSGAEKARASRLGAVLLQ